LLCFIESRVGQSEGVAIRPKQGQSPPSRRLGPLPHSKSNNKSKELTSEEENKLLATLPDDRPPTPGQNLNISEDENNLLATLPDDRPSTPGQNLKFSEDNDLIFLQETIDLSDEEVPRATVKSKIVVPKPKTIITQHQSAILLKHQIEIEKLKQFIKEQNKRLEDNNKTIQNWERRQDHEHRLRCAEGINKLLDSHSKKTQKNRSARRRRFVRKVLGYVPPAKAEDDQALTTTVDIRTANYKVKSFLDLRMKLARKC
jgi:hypothetical protein